MKWTVVWQPDAEQALTALWLQSRHRQALNDAAHELDAAAASDPLSIGESREENRRIVLLRPLAATIEVDRSTSTVYVLKVWAI